MTFPRTKKVKVRMKVSISGKLDGKEFGFDPGQVVLIDAALAEQWVTMGDRAEYVDASTPVTEPGAIFANSYAIHDPRVFRLYRRAERVAG